jgi:hypothetical protein
MRRDPWRWLDLGGWAEVLAVSLIALMAFLALIGLGSLLLPRGPVP